MVFVQVPTSLSLACAFTKISTQLGIDLTIRQWVFVTLTKISKKTFPKGQ